MRKKQLYAYHDRKVTITEICEEMQISETSLHRAKKRMSFQEAVDYCVEHKQTDLKNRTGGLSCADIERQYHLTPLTLAKFLKEHEDISLNDAIASLQRGQRKELSPRPEQLFYTNDKGEQIPISVSNYARMIGCGETSLYDYLQNGDTLEEAGKKVLQNKKEPIKYQGQSLRSFCVEHGYNAQVIIRKMKKGLSAEDAIEEYLELGQSDPKRWTYTYHKIILDSLLIRYQIDPVLVKGYLRNGDSLIDAIEKEAFFRTTNGNKKRNTNKKLYQIYKEIESLPSDILIKVLDKCHLSKEESGFFGNAFNHLAIVKRDLLLLEFFDEIEDKSDEEKASALSRHQVTKAEYQYIQDLLSHSFVSTEVGLKEKGKEATFQKVLYYNKPVNKLNK